VDDQVFEVPLVYMDKLGNRWRPNEIKSKTPIEYHGKWSDFSTFPKKPLSKEAQLKRVCIWQNNEEHSTTPNYLAHFFFEDGGNLTHRLLDITSGKEIEAPGKPLAYDLIASANKHGRNVVLVPAIKSIHSKPVLNIGILFNGKYNIMTLLL